MKKLQLRQLIREVINENTKPPTETNNALKDIDKETLDIMRAGFEDDEIADWIKHYHSKPQNHIPNTYYKVNRENTIKGGYAGVGNGLYLGKDKQALINFYDNEEEGFPIDTYMGNPKWLDLADYSKYEKFKSDLNKMNIKDTINSDKVGKIVMGMGFDGIRYYDPYATGEEFVLFNLETISKV
jgi:hypothetical protein